MLTLDQRKQFFSDFKEEAVRLAAESKNKKLST
jgi:hypothetical protein